MLRKTFIVVNNGTAKEYGRKFAVIDGKARVKDGNYISEIKKTTVDKYGRKVRILTNLTRVSSKIKSENMHHINIGDNYGLILLLEERKNLTENQKICLAKCQEDSNFSEKPKGYDKLVQKMLSEMAEDATN